MSKPPRITYTSRPDATPEDEIRALAAAYRVILRAHEEKRKGARPGAPDDGRKREHDPAKNHLTE